MSSNETRKILIAEKEYFPLLFTLRDIHPDWNLKFLTPQDVYDKLAFRFDSSKSNPISYLLKHEISFSKAKEYLHLLQILGTEANDKLKEVASFLPEEVLIKNPYAFREMRGEVILVEQEINEELQIFLEKHNINYQCLTLDDLGLKRGTCPSKVYLYEDYSLLFYDLFGKIRKRLLSNPTDQKKIAIHISEENYFYAVNIAKLFDIELFFHFSRPLKNEKDVQEALKEIKKNRSFKLSSINSEALKKLNSTIEEYALEALSNFDFAFLNLIEILQSVHISTLTTEQGISVYSNYVMNHFSEIYITDFRDGSFYDIKSDKSVFSDAKLKEMGANASYIKTELDKRKKRNFIIYQNIVYFARPLKHLNDHIYDSPFLEEFALKNEKADPIKNFEGVATSKSTDLMHAIFLNSKFIEPSTKNSYNSYDSRPQEGLSPFNKKSHYSLTDLESYQSCPYKYYLDKVLSSPIEEPFFMLRGSAIHSFFEDIDHPSFDFDISYERAMKVFHDEAHKKEYVVTPKDELLMDIVKDVLLVTKSFYEEFRLVSKRFETSDAEKCVSFVLEDDRGKYSFNGRIDKLLITENKETKERFYTIIDYKSGHYDFNIKDCYIGKCTQLPLYYYAIEAMEETKQDELTSFASFGGFGIAHNFFKKPSQMYKEKKFNHEELQGRLALEGIFINKASYKATIDPSRLSDDGKKKKEVGIFIDKKSHFIDSITDETIPFTETISVSLLDIVNDAKQGILNSIHAIEEGKFPLKPEKAGGNNSYFCKFCPYDDICYCKQWRDKSDNEKIKKQHFAELIKQKNKEEELISLKEEKVYDA